MKLLFYQGVSAVAVGILLGLAATHAANRAVSAPATSVSLTSSHSIALGHGASASGLVAILPSPSAFAFTSRVPTQSLPFVIGNPTYATVLMGTAPVLTAWPGQTLASEVLGYNTTNGTALVAMGTPTSLSLAALNARYPAPQPVARPTVSGTPQGVVGPGNPYINGAYVETGFNDFTNKISVGIVWDYISFQFTGSSVGNVTGYDHQSAPVPDGDYFAANQHYLVNYGTYAKSWSYNKEIAPLFGNTWIEWNDNTAVAHSNGSVSPIVRTYTGGPDTSMLVGPWTVVSVPPAS